MHGMTKREYRITDEQELRRIQDPAKVQRLGLAVDGKPYIYPMNYGYTMDKEGLKLYLHSAVQGDKAVIYRPRGLPTAASPREVKIRVRRRVRVPFFTVSCATSSSLMRQLTAASTARSVRKFIQNASFLPYFPPKSR